MSIYAKTSIAMRPSNAPHLQMTTGDKIVKKEFWLIQNLNSDWLLVATGVLEYST